MPDKKCSALIFAIIITALTAVVVLAIVSAISNFLSLNTSRYSMEKAVYAAQAGVYKAISDYKSGGGYGSEGSWNRMTAAPMASGSNAYYSVGKDANFLQIDADNPEIADDSNTAEWDNTLKNIGFICVSYNNPEFLTVDKMKVEWSGFDTTLREVWMDGFFGSTIRWSGAAASGDEEDLDPDFVIYAVATTDNYYNRSSYTSKDSHRIVFNNPIPKEAFIAATYIFSDGSSRKVALYNGGRSGNNEFSITSTGEARAGKNWKRTIEATYDASLGRITSWQEKVKHL